MTHKDFGEYIKDAIIKAWKDPAFKEKFLSNPNEAFKELGYEAPEGHKLQVVENSDHKTTIVLPAAPSDIEALSDSDLRDTAAAGKNYALKSVLV